MLTAALGQQTDERIWSGFTTQIGEEDWAPDLASAVYVNPDTDGVGAMHDVEAEAGDEIEMHDLFAMDLESAQQAGVALDVIAGAEAGFG
jgi:hypothetical protein